MENSKFQFRVYQHDDKFLLTIEDFATIGVFNSFSEVQRAIDLFIDSPLTPKRNDFNDHIIASIQMQLSVEFNRPLREICGMNDRTDEWWSRIEQDIQKALAWRPQHDRQN